MRVHVGYLLSDLGGGTGKHLRTMLRYLVDDRVSAEIVSEVESTVGSELPVSHRVLPPPGRLLGYPILQFRRYRQIEHYFADRAPDILHTYFFWSILYGRILKARGRVPVLVENREDLGFNWGRHEYALLRLTRGIPDRVVCVCEAVRHVVIEREGIDAHKTMTIHNGIEPRGDRPRPVREAKEALGFAAERPLVGMVANFDRPVKGVSYFIRAIPGILERVPAAHFVLIGGGESAYAVRRHAAELGVADNLTLTGFVPDVDRYYAALDVSVLTSLAEGLSLTLLESMNWGIPVVATRVGGNPELVVDGVTGVLVKPGDAAAVSEAVIRLLLDAETRERLGEAGRARAECEFALRDTVTLYRDLYDSLAAPVAVP